MVVLICQKIQRETSVRIGDENQPVAADRISDDENLN
jgi:hypothetical protein